MLKLRFSAQRRDPSLLLVGRLETGRYPSLLEREWSLVESLSGTFSQTMNQFVQSSAEALPSDHSFEPARPLRRGSLRSVSPVGRAAELRIHQPRRRT